MPVVVDADVAAAPAGLLAARGRTVAAEALLHDHLRGGCTTTCGVEIR